MENNKIAIGDESLNDNKKKVDLHIHTTASDGVYSPSEVVRQAALNGLSAIAITDHDTVSGISEAVLEGKVQGIQVIPGIELSVNFVPVMHVLGLFIDVNNEMLKQCLNRTHKLKKIIILNAFKKLMQNSIKVTPVQIIKSKKILSLSSLSEYVVEKKLIKSKEDAKAVLADLWKQWCISLPSMQEGIELIHSCGGVAILAHAKKLYLDNEHLKMTLIQLKKYGLDGMEIFHPNHMIIEREKYQIYAKEIGLLCSGGSDFHGNDRYKTMLNRETGISFSCYLKLKSKQNQVR